MPRGKSLPKPTLFVIRERDGKARTQKLTVFTSMKYENGRVNLGRSVEFDTPEQSEFVTGLISAAKYPVQLLQDSQVGKTPEVSE